MEYSEIPSDSLNSSNLVCEVSDNNSLSCLTKEEYLALIEDYIFPTPFEWILIGFHILVFIVGLIGNSLVCISVYRNPTMRTVTNYFITNLALADFLVILICLPPTVLWDVTETWFLGPSMCKTVLYFQGVSVSVSVLTLTFISADRWYAICYPLKFRSTTKKAKIGILLIWTVSLVIVLPDALYLDTQKNPSVVIETNYFTDCSYTWSDDRTKIYQLCITITLFVLPLLLMSMAYLQIAKVLWRKSIPGVGLTNRRTFTRSRDQHQGNNTLNAANANSSQQTDTHVRSRRKAAKMLIVVVAMFALCYFPVHLINTLRYTVGLPQNEFMTVASLVSHWLCYANSAINPLIYNFMSGRFRQEYRNVLSCCAVRNTRNIIRNRTTKSNEGLTRTRSETRCENLQLHSYGCRRDL